MSIDSLELQASSREWITTDQIVISELEQAIQACKAAATSQQNLPRAAPEVQAETGDTADEETDESDTDDDTEISSDEDDLL